MSRSSLEALLGELQATLPAAIESCSVSQHSQTEPILARLRGVLLSLLECCASPAQGAQQAPRHPSVKMHDMIGYCRSCCLGRLI